jgi:hypothetical protein
LGAKLPWRTGVARLTEWLASERGLALPGEGDVRPTVVVAAR